VPQFILSFCWNLILDVLIQAVLVHLLNTRNLNFSRRAPSDGQQSTSLNPLASAWVCLHFSCFIYFLTLKVAHCFSEVIELHIGISNFQNMLYLYQLLLLNNIWFPKCLWNTEMCLRNLFWCVILCCSDACNAGDHCRDVFIAMALKYHT
jgi:hypothetical protein